MRRRLTILGLCLACVFVTTCALILPAAFAADPQVVGSCALGSPVDVAVVGDYVYVAASDGLYIVDASNPATPVIAGSWAPPTWVNGLSGVAVAGTHAYLSDGANLCLWIVDVSDPAAPVADGSCGLPGYPYGVALAGDFAYVAAHYGGLQVVDVTNPAAPVAIGSCALPSEATAVAVTGDLACVADNMGGLQVVDVSNPAAPVVAGSCGPDGALGVAVAGSHAYVQDSEGGLYVVDLDDPATPVVAGSCGLSGFGNPRGVAVAGDFAYLANGPGGLWVVDVGNPAAPVAAGSCGLSGEAGGVAVAGNYAYLTAGDPVPALQIVDLGRPADAKALRPTASVKPTLTSYNDLVTVQGELRDASGALVTDRELMLQRSYDGDGWTNLKLLYSSTGSYSTTVRVVRRTYFRWRYAGDAVYASVGGSPCLVKCRASITPLGVPSIVRSGVKYTCRGLLKPQHAGGRAPLTISFYRYRSGSWRLVTTVKDSRWTNVTGATRYGVWFKIPARLAGKWRVRTMHEDADHVRTYSSYRAFVVR